MKPLKGVSTDQAKQEGPVSYKLNEERLLKTCKTMLMAEELEEGDVKKIFLRWNCFEGFGDEKYIRTRNIRLAHSAYKGQNSCLIIGAEAHRCKKKNNKRPTVDHIVSVKSLKHSNMDIETEKQKKLLDDYKLLICDNRCINEVHPLLKKKIAVKLDCTDMGALRNRLDWALKSASIQTGKGYLSIRVGSTLLTADELAENTRFVLRFLEDHIPDIWLNLKTVSLQRDGLKSIKILCKADPELMGGGGVPTPVVAVPVSPTKKRSRQPEADEEGEQDIETIPISERGIDIFSMRKKKKKSK
eukprot:TRINITY_DN1248_c0_g1_i1.p1 TRINITY_DN1248_c0_g1~~TRINITY_DN1248_c0_g1_i1.p1  ORF type:complete len:301 (+),score=64.17 TRINITY_DN1248_c0_g1_i1:69-971(+)